MARLFYGSLVLGILLAVAVAGIFPLPRHERYRSAISVIPDGGRAETFVVQWPLDRMDVEPGAGLGGAGGVTVLAQGGAVAASAEVFRLRDAAGNIVGLASRSTSQRVTANGVTAQGSDWVLLLPSRGALYLTQLNGVDVAPRARPGDGRPGPAAASPALWDGRTSLRITAGPAPGGAGRIAGGTEEFAGLAGSYVETWELEGSGPDGGTRGRITLDTRLESAP